nr:FMN reductase [Streptomyces sp.]
MPKVLTVSGSPSSPSRTTALLHHIADALLVDGHEVRHLSARSLPPGPLLHGDTAHVAIRDALTLVDWADALVIGTPVYKASYSGLLKTLLDVLPEGGLAEKTVLPLVTGGSPAHMLALDYALRPVLTALGCDRVLRGRFVLDRHISTDPIEGTVLEAETEAGVRNAVDRFVHALAAPVASA